MKARLKEAAEIEQKSFSTPTKAKKVNKANDDNKKSSDKKKTYQPVKGKLIDKSQIEKDPDFYCNWETYQYPESMNEAVRWRPARACREIHPNPAENCPLEKMYKETYNKDGKSFIEFLYDEHPDLTSMRNGGQFLTLKPNGQSIDFFNFSKFEGLKNYCITKSVSDVANVTNRNHYKDGEEQKQLGWKAAVTNYFPHNLLLLNPQGRSYVVCAYCHQLLQFRGADKGFVSHTKCPM